MAKCSSPKSSPKPKGGGKPSKGKPKGGKMGKGDARLA